MSLVQITLNCTVQPVYMQLADESHLTPSGRSLTFQPRTSICPNVYFSDMCPHQLLAY
jgi:hypothetical protein